MRYGLYFWNILFDHFSESPMEFCEIKMEQNGATTMPSYPADINE